MAALQKAQKINTVTTPETTQIIDDSIDMSMSETTAFTSYLTGVNAVQAMGRDSFLLSFAPTATESVLKKNNIASLNKLSEELNNNTNLLGKMVMDSIDEKRSEWEDECEKAIKIKVKAENLITLMSVRSKYLKDPQKMKEENYVNTLRENLINSDNNIEFYKKYMDSLLKDKSYNVNDERLATARLNYTAALESYENAKMTLTALNISLKKDKKNDGSSVYLDFVLNELNQERQGIMDLFSEYEEKYGCVPEYLKAYVDIINEIQRMASSSNPNLSGIKETFTNSVAQYIDILTDGPKVILGIANEYPTLQEMYDSECDLYYSDSGLDSAKNSTMFSSELNSMKKARHRIPGLSFSSLLCSEDKYPIGISDKIAVVIYGKPGIGKTASTEQMARRMGFYFKSLSIPHIDSSQISGLMAVNENDEVDQFLTKSMENTVKKYGILDLEEATASTDISVRNQMARLLQTGDLADGKKVHPLTIFVLTANDDKDDNSGIKPFSHVIKTRIFSVSLRNEQRLMSSWVNWLKHNDGIQKNPANKIACDMVLMFLCHSDEGRKYWFTNSKMQGTSISPNFRTWHKFILHTGRIMMDEGSTAMQKASDLKRIGSHIVGAEAAEKFVDYYSIIQKLPNISTMLNKIEEKSDIWKPLDFIRILDMKGNELTENTLTRKEEQDKEKMETKECKQFSIMVDKERDAALIDKCNKRSMHILESKGTKITEEEFKKSFLYKDVKKDLMNNKKLEEEYNNLWKSSEGRDGDRIDMTNSAIMFYFKSKITFEFDRLFETSARTKKPVDGLKLDRLIQLAASIPGKDQRLSLTCHLLDALTHDSSIADTAARYGVWYPASKNIKENRIYKYHSTKYPNYIKEQAQEANTNSYDKETNTMTFYKPYLLQMTNMSQLINDLSESYILARDTFLKDWMLTEKEKQGINDER